MDPTMKKLIDDAKKTNLEGGLVPRETLIRFLELDPNSEECEYLGLATREISRHVHKNLARVGSSIGIDLAPCTMNCRFCSLGEEWGLVKGVYVMSDENLIDLIKDVMSHGYSQFTIRTTEFFSLDALGELAKKIRREVPGVYGLTANTGELTLEDAWKLSEAGFSGAYHTIRLGEGRDTPFDPEVRINTMRSIAASPLFLNCGLDPIGIEHTNEEIVERLELFRSLNTAAVCTMRRINVKGTPFEGIPEVDDMRMAQISAVVRMASGGKWSVAIHPPIQKAMDWGANTTAVETGAIPRKNKHGFDKWSFEHEAIKEMFIKAGFEFGTWSQFMKTK